MDMNSIPSAGIQLFTLVNNKSTHGKGAYVRVLQLVSEPLLPSLPESIYIVILSVCAWCA